MWLVSCILLLVAAVGCDVKNHRIPNQLVLMGLGLGMATSLLNDGRGWQDAALGSLTGLALFLPLYMLRILGAGDVKLLTAVGSFVGYPGILTVALYTGLAGGILSLLIALHHGQLRTMLQHVRQSLVVFVMQMTIQQRPRQWVMVVGPHRLPYALAIALGTFCHLYFNK